MCGSDITYNPPAPVDYGESMREGLQAQVDLAPDLYAAEASQSYGRPAFARLNQQIIEETLLGAKKSYDSDGFQYEEKVLEEEVKQPWGDGDKIKDSKKRFEKWKQAAELAVRNGDMTQEELVNGSVAGLLDRDLPNIAGGLWHEYGTVEAKTKRVFVLDENGQKIKNENLADKDTYAGGGMVSNVAGDQERVYTNPDGTQSTRRAGFDEDGNFAGISALARDLQQLDTAQRFAGELKAIEDNADAFTEAYRQQGDIKGALQTVKNLAAQSAIPETQISDKGNALSNLAQSFSTPQMGSPYGATTAQPQSGEPIMPTTQAAGQTSYEYSTRRRGNTNITTVSGSDGSERTFSGATREEAERQANEFIDSQSRGINATPAPTLAGNITPSAPALDANGIPLNGTQMNNDGSFSVRRNGNVIATGATVEEARANAGLDSAGNPLPSMGGGQLTDARGVDRVTVGRGTSTVDADLVDSNNQVVARNVDTIPVRQGTVAQNAEFTTATPNAVDTSVNAGLSNRQVNLTGDPRDVVAGTARSVDVGTDFRDVTASTDFGTVSADRDFSSVAADTDFRDVDLSGQNLRDVDLSGDIREASSSGLGDMLGLRGSMAQQALDDLDLGGDLSDRERRAAQQAARVAASARGRGRDTSSILSELEANENLRRARRNERRAFAGQVLGMEGQFASQEAGMDLQAQMANQGRDAQGLQFDLAEQQANQQNDRASLQAALVAQQANQAADMTGSQMDLAAQQANQQAGITGSQMDLAAQQANLQAGLTGAQMDLTAQQANQRGDITGAEIDLASQQANQRADLTGNQLGVTAQQSNQARDLTIQQSDLAAQRANQDSTLRLNDQNLQQLQLQLARDTSNADRALQAEMANQSRDQAQFAANQRGQIENQNFRLQLDQMNLQAQQANQQAGLQAGMANQQADLNRQLSNQQADLQAQQLNQQAGLTLGARDMAAMAQNQQTQMGLTQMEQAALAANQQAEMQRQARLLDAAKGDIDRGIQVAQINQGYQAAGLAADRSAAAQRLGLEQATVIDPTQALFGRASGAGTFGGQSLYGNAANTGQLPTMYNPAQGAQFIANQAADLNSYNAAFAGAQAQASAGKSSMMGNIIGGGLGMFSFGN